MPEEKLKAGLPDAANCKKAFNNIVFLPVNPSIPKKEMDIMIKRVLGIVNRYQLLAEFMSKAKNR
jgi:energy-coupling factor transporter ATP-binding protein EcfA2